MWNRQWVVLAAILMMAVGFRAQADMLDQVKERGVLRVATYKDYQPFSFKKGGRLQGVDVALAKELGNRLGFNVSLMPFPADETVDDDLRNMVWKGHYLGTGVADVMMHVPHDRVLASNNDRVQILAPYYHDRIMIVFNQSRISMVTSLNVFREHRVGVELDTLADHYLTSIYGGALRENVVHFQSAEDAVVALRNGEIDAVMAPLSHVEGALGEASSDYGVVQPRLTGAAVSGWDVGVAVKAGSDQLAAVVGKAMSEMHSDGTVRKIFRSHGLTYVDPAK